MHQNIQPRKMTLILDLDEKVYEAAGDINIQSIIFSLSVSRPF